MNDVINPADEPNPVFSFELGIENLGRVCMF